MQTILVITDGVPDNKIAVEQVIINATKTIMEKDEDLSITIVQVAIDYLCY
jgi:Mg-chelatase subunit ChlD